MHTARRADDIEPFRVMAILARARELEAAGRDIIHLEIGEPDFATPEPIVEAGIAALRAGLTHYTPALGLPVLRTAISHYYGERYGVDVAPDRVCVTPGASGALLLAMAALFNPGRKSCLPILAIPATGISPAWSRQRRWAFRSVRRVAIN
jgi:aspartate/methionine/tyrosine aminotransferase